MIFAILAMKFNLRFSIFVKLLEKQFQGHLTL